MPDDPRSPWTEASPPGLYSLSLDELREIIRIVREAEEQRGVWLSAPELQQRLRRPGS